MAVIMSDGAGESFSLRCRPAVAGWLAFGWSAAVAAVYLVAYEGGERLVLLASYLPSVLPVLAVGEHARDFWTQRLLDLGWCLALLLTAFPVGAILVRFVTGARDLISALVALGVGLWIVSVVVLLLGLWRVAAVPWAFALAAAWLTPTPWAYFQKTGPAALDGWSRILVGLCGLAVVLCWLSACTPPFEYDELEYHLGAPSEYIKAGRIQWLPHNFYSNLSQGAEMLYLLALVSRSDIAPKMLHCLWGVLAALATYAVAARLWSHRVGVTAAALFYVAPFTQDLSQTARIDLATAFYAALALGCVLRVHDGNRWLWLGAWMSGAAVATKWTAIPVILVPAAIMVLWMRRPLGTAVAFGLVAAVPVTPWWLKNWALAGNPIYPLATTNEYWTAAQAARFADKHYPKFDATGLWEFLERPWHYSFGEWNALPVLLMTLPLVVLVRANPRLRRLLGLCLVVYLGWYLATFRPWRFLFPAFPLLAMLGACGLHAVGRLSRWVVVLVWLSGLATMSLTLLVDAEEPGRVPPQAAPVQLLTGQLSAREFLGRLGGGMFEPILWMNENLPAQARVLYIGEARVHHARHPVVWATAFDRHPVTRADLTELGVTHVYANFSEWRRLTQNYDYLRDFDHAGFRRFLQDPQKARLIFDRDRYKVWELIP